MRDHGIFLSRYAACGGDAWKVVTGSAYPATPKAGQAERPMVRQNLGECLNEIHE